MLFASLSYLCLIIDYSIVLMFHCVSRLHLSQCDFYIELHYFPSLCWRTITEIPLGVPCVDLFRFDKYIRLIICNYQIYMLKFIFFSFCSFGDESGAAMFGDIKLLAAGYALIITYVCIVFGRMNTVQHRVRNIILLINQAKLRIRLSILLVF